MNFTITFCPFQLVVVEVKIILERRIKMTNEEIKKKIKKNRILYYEIAEYLKISPYLLSIWFRKPLNESKQKEIIEAIEAIKSK